MGSEPAFQALVEKHLGLVLGAATRRTGNRLLAEEVAQSVFAILARKASSLRASASLAGWLYRATMFECAEALRREFAREQKMKRISENTLNGAEGESVWREALPLLDEAIDALPEADRELILLRFFERKSFREIGESLRKTEAASQKQAERALQKISRSLGRKGVAISAALLASGLMARVAEAAPSALAATISQGALAAASKITTGTLILKTIQTMSYAKTKTALVVAVAAMIPIAAQWQANRELRSDLDQLRSELAGSHEVSPAGPASETPTAARSARVAAAPAMVAPAATPEATAVALSPGEFARQWELALFEQDPVQRSLTLSSLLKDLTAGNAPAVADAFERAGQTGMRFSDEQRLFLRAWGALDGRAAIAHAVGPSGDVKGSSEVLSALAGWSSKDPLGARQWVDTLVEGNAKEKIVLGLLDGWAMVDFHGASAYAETRPRSPVRDQFREMLLNRALMSGGIPAAQQWFYGIRDDEHNRLYKSRAFDEVIQSMLYRDPASAARWISQLEGRPYLSGHAIANTAAKMAETAPKETLDWLLSLDGMTDKQAKSGLGVTVGQWAKQDAHGAGNWLGQNRHHPAYDAMADRYAREIARTNPEVALQWAQTIADDGQRAYTENKVARSLFKEQGNAAAATLAAAGFSDERIRQAQRTSTTRVITMGNGDDLQFVTAVNPIEMGNTGLGALETTIEVRGTEASAAGSGLVDFGQPAGGGAGGATVRYGFSSQAIWEEPVDVGDDRVRLSIDSPESNGK